ncbi:MAG: glycoside hydrolase family 2 protein [Solirubrobacteraceae bacterium]
MRRALSAISVVLAAVALVAVVARGAGGDGGPLPARSGPAGERTLTGGWVLRGDRAGRGVALGWPAGGFRGRSVSVPFSPNATHVTGAAGARSFAGSVAWYRTTFTVGRAGDYAVDFESVNHRATVWVDGRRVARHTGTYLPFEARAHLTAGRHQLVVRADWRDPIAMKAAAWHRTWFNFGGINGPVRLRELGASELDSPSLVTALRPDGSAQVDVTVRVTNRRGPRTLRVRGSLGGQTLPFAPVAVARGGAAPAPARVVVHDPDLWAPGHPALTALRLAVGGESAYAARVGLRELRWGGGRLQLNGHPLRLRGASLQEDAPGRGDALLPGDMDAIVRRLRAIGANATRTQHPLAPALLDRLDAAGILVWQEVGPVDAPGAWTSRTPAQQRRALRRARINVIQARLHPSVLAWNLANEVAGNGHFGGQPAYIEHAARMIKRLDPGRPVALDVWGTHMPDVAGPMYRDIDAIGATNYTGWYTDTYDPAAVVNAGIASFLSELHRVFAGKVLVVTEFGAEANALNPPGQPGSFAFQARLLTRHIAAYEAAPWLDGELVWNLQDFALTPAFAGGSIRREVPAIQLEGGINQKGLFSYDGRPKPAVAAVRRAFARAG